MYVLKDKPRTKFFYANFLRRLDGSNIALYKNIVRKFLNTQCICTQARVCRKCAYICARTWFLSSFITSRTPTPFTAFDAYNTLHPLFPPSPLNQRLHYFLPLKWLYHLCRSSNVDCRVPWYYRRRVGILMALVVNDFSDFYETLIAPFSNVHLMSL